MSTPKTGASLDGALRAVFASMAAHAYVPSYIYGSKKRVKLPPLAIRRVEVRGRSVAIHVAKRREPCRGDRLALLTLARDLWGEILVDKCHDARDFAAEEEITNYISAMRRVSEAEARLLYAHHFPDQYMQTDERLGGLFPRKLYASTRLSDAASEGALVKRALPHATKGAPLDRIAAIQVIDCALSGAWTHRDWNAMSTALRALAAKLARDKEAILRECAWMLVRKVAWGDARLEALTPDDRKRLRLPPRPEA